MFPHYLVRHYDAPKAITMEVIFQRSKCTYRLDRAIKIRAVRYQKTVELLLSDRVESNLKQVIYSFHILHSNIHAVRKFPI